MPPSSGDPVLHLRLFGGCEFRHADSIVRLETIKTSALLAYLALQRVPQPRHKLIGLLWGNLPEASARANLRHALWHLRSVFSSPEHPPLILTEQQTVAFNPAVPYSLDVEEFLLRLKREAELTSDATHPDHRATLLREAMDLYGGDLLEGFYVDDAPAFEEWLLVERERLRAQAVDALHRLVAYYFSWGEYDPGLDYARRLLEMEPWWEDAHRQMMRLLALSGQRSAALAQYETCRRVLAEQLNAEPSPETQTLYESIRVSAEEMQPPHTAAPVCHLPPQDTPFVGRAEELTRLAALLRNPACQLITLVGPGGVGKTRLAIRAAVNADTYRDGIFFVPLVGVGSADLLVSAIADAIGLMFQGGANPQTVLLDYLREKELLLLMDNFEHLLAGADLATEILQAATRVKMLVTSRERLNLREEWLFEVEGLDYPTDEVRGRRDEKTPASSFTRSVHPLAFDSYSAVQLFIQGAQRVRLGFGLADDDKPFVARLCQLVDGMPLAIELAANWVRILSCQEIVARMEQGMDFLATTWRDLPARHRSMCAVFERSWQLLSHEERRVFKRLSVFRGGFQLDAAEQVAGANLGLLVSLGDKSFLRCNPAGRYDVHELLRQHGEEKLSDEEKTRAREHHAQYWAEFLHQREETVWGPSQKQVLDEIAEEIENVRAAWTWALQNRQVIDLDRATHSLFVLYDTRGLQQEGADAFKRAIEQLGGTERMLSSPEAAEALVLTKLVGRLAMFCDRLSLWQQGWELARQSLASAHRLNAPGEIAMSLAALVNNTSELGEYAQAKQWGLQDLALARARGTPRQAAAALQRLGDIDRALGDYAQAKQFLTESIAISEKNGNDEMRGYSLIILGYLECELREYAAAKQHGEEVIRVFQTLGNPLTTTHGFCILGQAALGVHAHPEAQAQFCRALEFAKLAQSQCRMLEVVYWLALLLTQKGDRARAAELASLVKYHPQTELEWRDCAVRLLAELESQLPPEVIAAAKEKAQRAKLEEVVETVLADR